MSKIIFFHLFIFVTLTLYSQTSPNTIVIPNPTPNPPYISSDTYTRAISSIKLQDGFKWGFVTGSSTNVNLLNLNLGTNPAFVSSAYLGSGSNPNVISCGSVPTIDISKPVGETAGGFQVTGNGAASYNIAITVSPGTKGVQPMLGLSYNSQGGLGLLGVGWNLTGLSAISRTGKVPMHDGVFSGAQLSISDVYSLDGNRLFSLSGTYGQSYTTYYNESENFATITSFGSAGNGPERFEVKDKNGNLLKYGHDNNSSLKGVGDNTTMVWYLNELKDEFGNYMKYFYKQLNGETVIDKIEYTGNASAGLNPYNKITFSYIPLAEHNKTYIKGIEFNQTQLVKDISCWSGSTVFKKYILDYEWQGGSYLSSVKEVDANGIELNPTKFCWDNPNDFDGTKTNQNLDANFTTSDYADLTTIPVDFDGDGFSDFACWNTGIGRHRVYQNTFLNNYGSTNSTINFTNIFDNASQISTTDALLSSNVTDADGNGKQELYTIISPRKYLQSGFTFSDEYTILKTFSNSSNAIQVTSLGTFNTSSVFDVEALPPQMFFGVDDYTGDGVKDNLRIDNESITLESLNSTYVHSYNPSSKSFTRPFNFDGDAVSDYILITDNMTSLTVNVIKFSGSSFYTSSTGNITIQFPNNGPAFKFLCRHISFGDLNGDGLDDLVYINESNSAMYMMKNTGNSFASAVQIQAFTALSSSNAFDISCVDVNADGKKDIIINEANNSTNTTTYYSYLSYGDLILKGGSYIGDWRVGEASRVTYHQFSKNISDYQEVWTRTGKGKVVTGSDIHYADFNGDGIYDYLNLDNSSNFAITNNVNGEPRLSITTIYTPFRNNIQIRYANIGSRFSINNGIKDEVLKPITNPGFVNNIGTYLTNMYCVSHVFNTSGFSGQFQSVLRYLYKNPKHHRYGRGFFGFEEVTSIDLNTMVGTASTSSIDPAYFIPLVYKQESSKLAV